MTPTQARILRLLADRGMQTRLLPDESVNCVVTSPPYWGLRDYGVEGQLGLEPTPEEFVCNLVDVFREVRRVLRADGTVWLNLGDSYSGSVTVGRRDIGRDMGGGRGGNYQHGGTQTLELKQDAVKEFPGLKQKDMVGIPWRVAFALQADGWWLRSDIIWSKPNPMPESVTDRPTKSHEYIFLLSKSATYYYDAAAIQEPYSPATIQRVNQPNFDNQKGGPKDPMSGNRSDRKTLEHLKQNIVGKRGYVGFNERWDKSEDEGTIPNGRNKRTVWEVATEPYAEAHFATFPTALVKPCILAGCPEGGIVLDPFLGSGTTALVAKVAGRDYIGIELNESYVELAKRRINVDQERML